MPVEVGDKMSKKSSEKEASKLKNIASAVSKSFRTMSSSLSGDKKVTADVSSYKPSPQLSHTGSARSTNSLAITPTKDTPAASIQKGTRSFLEEQLYALRDDAVTNNTVRGPASREGSETSLRGLKSVRTSNDDNWDTIGNSGSFVMSADNSDGATAPAQPPYVPTLTQVKERSAPLSFKLASNGGLAYADEDYADEEQDSGPILNLGPPPPALLTSKIRQLSQAADSDVTFRMRSMVERINALTDADLRSSHQVHTQLSGVSAVSGFSAISQHSGNNLTPGGGTTPQQSGSTERASANGNRRVLRASGSSTPLLRSGEVGALPHPRQSHDAASSGRSRRPGSNPRGPVPHNSSFNPAWRPIAEGETYAGRDSSSILEKIAVAMDGEDVLGQSSHDTGDGVSRQSSHDTAGAGRYDVTSGARPRGSAAVAPKGMPTSLADRPQQSVEPNSVRAVQSMAVGSARANSSSLGLTDEHQNSLLYDEFIFRDEPPMQGVWGTLGASAMRLDQQKAAAIARHQQQQSGKAATNSEVLRRQALARSQMTNPAAGGSEAPPPLSRQELSQQPQMYQQQHTQPRMRDIAGMGWSAGSSQAHLDSDFERQHLSTMGLSTPHSPNEPQSGCGASGYVESASMPGGSADMMPPSHFSEQQHSGGRPAGSWAPPPAAQRSQDWAVNSVGKLFWQDGQGRLMAVSPDVAHGYSSVMGMPLGGDAPPVQQWPASSPPSQQWSQAAPTATAWTGPQILLMAAGGVLVLLNVFAVVFVLVMRMMMSEMKQWASVRREL